MENRSNKEIILELINFLGYTDRKTIVELMNFCSSNGDKSKTVARNIKKMKDEELEVSFPFNTRKEVYCLSNNYLKKNYDTKNKVENFKKCLKINECFLNIINKNESFFNKKNIDEIINNYIYNYQNKNLNYDYDNKHKYMKVFDAYVKCNDEFVVIYIDKNIEKCFEKLCCYYYLVLNGNKDLKLNVVLEEGMNKEVVKNMVSESRNRVFNENFNPYNK